MNLGLIALLGFVLLFLLMMIGLPIAYAMLISGLAGIIYLKGFSATVSLLAMDIWAQFSSYGMIVIPLFTFMGCVAFQTGIGERLYNSADKFVGHRRGGLCFATIVTGALFGAMCGSPSAEVATITKVALPEMRRYNYDDGISTACIAASSGLAILIPPSANLIVYGVLTGDSITELFAAGIVPGILLTLLFIAAIIYIGRKSPKKLPFGGTRCTWKERLKSLNGMIEFIILIALVLGGLLAGWFTASEAGAVGAAGAILIGVVRRTLNWKKLYAALVETANISGVVFLMVACAMVFGHFMVYTRVPNNLSMWIAGLNVPPQVVLLVIILFYLIGGCVIDALPLFMLTVPILYPIISAMGYSGIWFGIIIVLISQTGLITPPVGMSVYIINSVAPDVPIGSTFKSVIPFVVCEMILAVILVLFPSIATFLPNLL